MLLFLWQKRIKTKQINHRVIKKVKLVILLTEQGKYRKICKVLLEETELGFGEFTQVDLVLQCAWDKFSARLSAGLYLQ